MSSTDLLHALSDAALESRIERCSREFVAAHYRYEASRCLVDASERNRWWLAELAALRERARRPAIVRRMEREIVQRMELERGLERA